MYDDNATLTRALQELQTSLQLDPSNTPALTLADNISSWMPDILNKNGNSYEYLALTATPTLRPTDIPVPTETVEATTDLSEALNKPTATDVPAAIEPSPTSAPDATPEPASAPICGGAALIPAMLGVFWLKKRAKMF